MQFFNFIFPSPCPVGASSEWIQMDTEEKHAPIEVETNELPKEETAQNSAPPMEVISKAPVGEMSLPVDMAGGRVVTLGMIIY
jgi:hypothetical protein